LGQSVAMRDNLHFAQNDEAAAYDNGLQNAEEGPTVCVSGGSGCTSTSGVPFVRSHQSGLSTCETGDSSCPARTAGMLAYFFSPDASTFTWDGSTYSGARGHTKRASFASAAASTSFHTLVVAKITPNFGTDDTFTASASNPDANWTGFTSTDHAGFLPTDLSVLQTSFPATSMNCSAGCLIAAGLQAGTYDLTKNGTLIQSITVTDGDNSAYFKSTGTATYSLTLNGAPGASQTLPGPGSCPLFPSTAVWNRTVLDLPVSSNSATLVSSIGATSHLRYDRGIPIANVPGTQPLVGITILYPDESDPGPWPIPPDAPVETGGTDNHVIIVDRDNCHVYEMYGASLDGNGTTWTASSTATWDLALQTLRTDGWTSTDAAGLPIVPFLIRYEEIAGGIHHSIRFTAPLTRNTHIWPARHDSGTNDSNLPPMGQRFRLKSSFVISGFGPQATAILEAMKTYGLMLADNGQAWGMQIASDAQNRWDDADLLGLFGVLGSNIEAVDESGVMMDYDSAQAISPGTAPTKVTGTFSGKVR
jgi:hypothetical protein